MSSTFRAYNPPHYFALTISETRHLSIRNFCFDDCTHDLLLSFMEFLRDSGSASSTCNNRLAAIRAYLWYAADEDITIQPVALTASHVPFIRVPKLTRETISEKTLSALLAAPPDTKVGKRDRMILILLYDSAIRVSELISLDVRSVNLVAELPYIRVYGKGDKERIVAITDATAKHISNYLRSFHVDPAPDSPLIYTVIKGDMGRMSVGNVERIIKKYAVFCKCKFPKVAGKNGEPCISVLEKVAGCPAGLPRRCRNSTADM